MNGNPIANGWKLYAIDIVELKVTKSSVKSTGNPHTVWAILRT